MREAQLQGADLWGAQLQGAYLHRARLQGADLAEARLQRAVLMEAQLQGTNLYGAELQYANLFGATLEGANLYGAELQAAVLIEAKLQGAVLGTAALYGAIVYKSDTALVDLRSAHWTPLQDKQLMQLRELLSETVLQTKWRERTLEQIERAGDAGQAPPILESCLIDPEVRPGLKCQRQWLRDEVDAFRSELFPVLEEFACGSSAIARGLIRQIDASDITDGRFGLAGRFVTLLDKRECQGLSALPEADKNQIRKLAKRDEGRRGQFGAGKPAE